MQDLYCRRFRAYSPKAPARPEKANRVTQDSLLAAAFTRWGARSLFSLNRPSISKISQTPLQTCESDRGLTEPQKGKERSPNISYLRLVWQRSSLNSCSFITEGDIYLEIRFHFTWPLGCFYKRIYNCCCNWSLQLLNFRRFPQS